MDLNNSLTFVSSVGLGFRSTVFGHNINTCKFRRPSEFENQGQSTLYISQQHGHTVTSSQNPTFRKSKRSSLQGTKRRSRPIQRGKHQDTHKIDDSQRLTNSERLQKVLSRMGVASRREAEKLIEERKVRVNGKIVKTQGTLINTASDKIQVNGKEVGHNHHPVWIAMHKPKGYVCTEGIDGKLSISSLIHRLKKHNLVPVGRIEEGASGLMLLTNERDYVSNLSSPQNLHMKIWHVDCMGAISNQQIAPMRQGLNLDGEKLPTPTAGVTILGTESVYLNPKKTAVLTRIEVRIRDSRRHILRRMFESLGFEVVRLSRRTFGPVLLGSLKRGDHRRLTPNEIKALKRGVSGKNLSTRASTHPR